MIILGINFGHNSSICLIKDGKILFAIEEEKVSRVKNDFFWPKKSISRLLKEYKIKYSDINYISLQRDCFNLLGYDNVNYRLTRNKIYLYKDFIDRTLNYYSISKRKDFFSKENFISKIKNLGFKRAKINFFDHHLSHAASAFYTSPFESDLVITCDGFGGKDSFNFYSTKNKKLQLIRKNDYKVSVGQFYSMITVLLGFKSNRHEGKITGLAAYGKKTILLKKFRKLWTYNEDSLNRFPLSSDNEFINKAYNSLSLRNKINIKSAGNNILNDYTKNNYILLEWLKKETTGFSNEDIAYSCQKVSEEIIINEIKKVKAKHFKNKNIKISLAGGVFANVRINQLIYELNFVDNIFIHPAMEDSGLALGNAILSYLENNNYNINQNHFSINNTYLGPDYSNDLNNFITSFNSKNVLMIKMKNPSKEIAELLVKNKIIGFWSNRMEWGPRALGARSIILNTFDKSVNDSLNERLNRTEFMPFAPVVLDFIAKDYFPKYKKIIPAAKYMTITYDTKPKYFKELQAVVHVDGTARPQVISKNDNPFYYEILYEFYKISGCGALVNTSFNAHEEPILSSPSTAINALLEKRVDYLVMENFLFSLK